MSIKIKYDYIKIAAIAFLFIPVALFFLFFLKPVIGIPIVVISLAALIYFFVKNNEKDSEDYFSIKLWVAILFIIAMVVWCLFGGQAGLMSQSSDWNERNAIFRDLITFDWPVYYPETDTALVYYIGLWLPAAAIAKIHYSITQDAVAAFDFGNVLLAIWVSIGVIIVLALILNYFKRNSAKCQIVILLIFVLFSGMDIIGGKVSQIVELDYLLNGLKHLEWWDYEFQYSSITTCLFWVFNQAVPAWVATMLFANEKKSSLYIFILAAALLCAPLPSIGLAVLMVCRAIYFLSVDAKTGAIKPWLKSIFSWPNLTGLILILPPIALYLFTNWAIVIKATNNGISIPKLLLLVLAVIAVAVVICVLVYVISKKNRKKLTLNIIHGALILLVLLIIACLVRGSDRIPYLVFLLLDYGCCIIVLLDEHKNDFMYYVVAGELIFIPLIRVGVSSDFCMRASIPAILILMLMVIKAIIEDIRKLEPKPTRIKKKVIKIILVVIVVIGAITPAVEFYRVGYNTSINTEASSNRADRIKTLNKYNKKGNIYANFVSDEYEDSFFFKYLAK